MPKLKTVGYPIHDAIKEGKSSSMLGMYLSGGVDLNQLNTEGYTPLHLAIKHNNLDIAKFLLSYQLNINMQDPHGRTPLTLAIEENRSEMVKLLIMHGADFVHQNVRQIGGLSDQINQLHLAAIIGNEEVITFLLDMGVNSRELSKNGMTAAQFAYQAGNIAVEKILLSAEVAEISLHTDNSEAQHMAVERLKTQADAMEAGDESVANVRQVILIYKELENLANGLRNVSENYHPKNEERQQALFRLDEAIAEAYETFARAKNPEELKNAVDGLKESAAEIALQTRKNHQVSSPFSFFTKSRLDKKITAVLHEPTSKPKP